MLPKVAFAIVLKSKEKHNGLKRNTRKMKKSKTKEEKKY